MKVKAVEKLLKFDKNSAGTYRLSRAKVNISLLSLLENLISSNILATQQSKSELFSAFAARKFGVLLSSY